MQNDILTPETVSKEKLKAALDAAFIDASFDSDGDLMISEEIRCYAFLNEKKDRIRLYSQFGVRDDADQDDILRLVNAINCQYRVVRAYVNVDNPAIRFDFEIIISGGITVKNFVLCVKRFCGIPRDAIKDLDSNCVTE